MLEEIGDSLRRRLRQWTEEQGGQHLKVGMPGLQRVENEFGVDPFGFSLEYALAAAAPLIWLYQNYFRVQTFGIEQIPPGRVLLVGNHSGQLPFDATMVAIALLLEGKPPRVGRSMVEKWVPQLPYVSAIMARIGQIVGTPENCRRVLAAEEAILVFPEGTRGLNKLAAHKYQLQEFGLGFMRLALEMNAPIVPVGIVGAEEQAQSLVNIRPLAKLLGFPAFPITYTGLPLPLPSRYRLYFGAPLHFTGRADDEDAELDKKVRSVKEAITALLQRGLQERKHVFW